MLGLESPDGHSEISRVELVKYLSGTLDDDVLRHEIETQARITGSFVSKWLADMERKGSDPLNNIDWEQLAKLDRDNEE